MTDHAVLSIPGDHELGTDTYDPDGGKFILKKARDVGAGIGVDVKPFLAQTADEVRGLLPKLRQYRYLTIDAHGSDGEVLVFDEWWSPSDFNLRNGSTELLVFALCWQEEEKLNGAVPAECRVISYGSRLKDGSWKALVRQSGLVDELLDVPLDSSAASKIADWVKEKSEGGTHRLTDWIAFESD